jgi:hypothetical protein
MMAQGSLPGDGLPPKVVRELTYHSRGKLLSLG